MTSIRGKTWTEHEQRILRIMYAEKTREEIMRSLPNRPWSSIVCKASELHITGRKRGGGSVDQRNRIRKHRPGLHEIFRELRSLRISRGISQATLAKKVGYNKTQISAWECGEWYPKFNALIAWTEALGLKIVLREKSAPSADKPLPRLGYTGMNSVRLVGQ